MPLIGFSTGALALGDFRRGLELVVQNGLKAVELSALRAHELEPLVRALPDLDLTPFQYVSLHAPSGYDADAEPEILRLLEKVADRNIPLIAHPDSIHDFKGWRAFGRLLCLENMDSRKPTGRSVAELGHFFDLLPQASFCFDIGHAKHFDPSMTEAGLLLAEFRSRLRQLHVSEVNTLGRHERLSWLSYFSFQRVAARIPPQTPILLESMVQPHEIGLEADFALECLAPKTGKPEAQPAGQFIPEPARGD